MFRFSLLDRGVVASQALRRRISARHSRQSRRLSVESLERREMFDITPMAPITFGGELGDAGYAIAFDHAHNKYVTGVYSDTVDFDLGSGVTNLTSNGNSDIFVTKYNADGSLAWARGFGSPYQDSGGNWLHSIAVDGIGNVYVATTFAGTVEFDDIVLTSTSPSGQPNWISNMVMRLDPGGNVDWAQSFGNSTFARDFVLHDQTTVSGTSSVYIVGQFSGTQTFASQQLASTAGGTDGFLTRIDASTGTFLSTTKTAGKGAEVFTGVAVDASGSGSLYLTGYKRDEALIGSSSFSKQTGKAALVAKADLDGNFQWAKLTATGSSEGWGITVANSNVFVTGLFDAQYANFGSIGLTNANGKRGGGDIFVTRMDANGNVNWAVGVGSTGFDRADRIVTDTIGNVFIAGSIGGQANFGADQLQAGHYISQLDAASGQFIKSWSLRSGIQFRNINTDQAGNLWVTGLFTGTCIFPDGTMVTSNSGSSDIFIVQFANPAVLVSALAPSQTASATDEPSGNINSAVLLKAASVEHLFAEPESTWTRKSRTKIRG